MSETADQQTTTTTVTSAKVAAAAQDAHAIVVPFVHNCGTQQGDDLQKEGDKQQQQEEFASDEARAARLEAWSRDGAAEAKRLLGEHGAVVLRGLPVASAELFLKLIRDELKFTFDDSVFLGGGGPRVHVVGPVHTSTESPPNFHIPLHHELSYLTYPDSGKPACQVLAFWCDVPPQSGGNTPVARSDVLLARIASEKPDFLAAVRARKVRYVRRIESRATVDTRYQRGWEDMFQADTREEAERAARATGHERVEWLDNGDLHLVSAPQDPVREVVVGGRKVEVWYNSIVLLSPAAHDSMDADAKENAPWSVVFADDETPLAADDVRDCKRIMDECAQSAPWQRTDVLLVDNDLCLHSRDPFEPPRRILAAMSTSKG